MPERKEIQTNRELAAWYDAGKSRGAKFYPLLAPTPGLCVKLPDTEVGWLAGIFDGEGTARISRCIPKAHKRPSFQYSVEAHAATNTDPLILSRICCNLKALDVDFRVYSNSGKTMKSYWKQSSTVRIWGIQSIFDYLYLIYPLITGKHKARAEAVLEFLLIPKRRSYGKGGRPVFITELYHSLYIAQPFRSGSAPAREYGL